MKTPTEMPRLKGYRFPRAVVAYAVWVYHRFALSTADVGLHGFALFNGGMTALAFRSAITSWHRRVSLPPRLSLTQWSDQIGFD